MTIPKTIKQDCSFKRESIRFSDLNDFEILPYRRKIRKNHSNKILKSLLDGTATVGVFVLNKVNGKRRIIDGNHRYDAIEKFLTQLPNNKVEILTVNYENLTQDEERKLYTLYNTVISQGTNDFVQMYAPNIKILQAIKKNFPTPVSIYNLSQNQNGVHFACLMKSYFTAKTKFPKLSVYTNGGYAFIEELQKLNQNAYDTLVDFVKFFEETFGYMCKTNEMQTTTMLAILMILYLDNRDKIARKTLINLFKKKLRHNPNIATAAKQPGIIGTYSSYEIVKAALASCKLGKEKLIYRDVIA